MSKELMAQEQENQLTTQVEAPMGFEDEEDGDVIIPRIKVVQTLSPERKEKQAEEGDVINSLTKDKLNGKVFIPVFKINSNILWKPRSEGGGIQCQARDGKMGLSSDGTSLMCKACRKNEFDNSKTGKEALPACTKYINFFGFFEGERMPIILSFAKTNYKEGKTMYSLAKVTMQNMWNHGYALNSKLMSKGNNEWYIINPSPNGATSVDDRKFGEMLYKQFRNADLNYDTAEDTSYSDNPPVATNADIENVEY